MEERQLSSGQAQLAMAEGGPARGRNGKPRAQSIWERIPNLRQSIRNKRRKHSEDVTATIRPHPHLDDTLLQTIPESASSFTVENPYVERVDEDSRRASTTQDPGEDILDILNIDGPDEQNSSILPDGYRQSKLTAKVVKILTIVFLFSVILVCATLSKLCLVAITTQMHHALTVNFAMQPASNIFKDCLEETDEFNDTTDAETEITCRNALQSLNSTPATSEEQPTKTGRTSSGPQRITKQQQSIAFIQVVIVLMASQLVTFLRMMFGGIIGKSSATYPWPSIGAIALVSLHTHTHTHMRACAHARLNVTLHNYVWAYMMW